MKTSNGEEIRVACPFCGDTLQATFTHQTEIDPESGIGEVVPQLEGDRYTVMLTCEHYCFNYETGDGFPTGGDADKWAEILADIIAANADLTPIAQKGA